MSTGNKFDDQKLRYDLLSFKATKGLVEVLTFGGNKYGVTDDRLKGGKI